MMRISTLVLAALMLALSACTAITDFKEPGDTVLYVLSENVPTSVTVALADTAGSLTLNLTSPLPTADSDATLLALLADGTIAINVANNETGVSFDLTTGVRVDGVPAAAGEYALALDETRQVLTVTFFNETTTGAALRSGGGYTASFSIIDNAYFAVEEFTRAASVE